MGNTYNREYYLRHREAIIARQIAWNKAHKERLRDYYQRNKERLSAYQQAYYWENREQRIAYQMAYQKNYRRQHVISYHDSSKNIYGVNKPPYPADGKCPYCREVGQLQFHHWDDNNPSDGLWLCASCHSTKKLLALLKEKAAVS